MKRIIPIVLLALLTSLAGSGTWLDGKRFGGNVSEADLQSWIEGLK